jgi:hypothetical protein
LYAQGQFVATSNLSSPSGQNNPVANTNPNAKTAGNVPANSLFPARVNTNAPEAIRNSKPGGTRSNNPQRTGTELSLQP